MHAALVTPPAERDTQPCETCGKLWSPFGYDVRKAGRRMRVWRCGPHQMAVYPPPALDVAPEANDGDLF